MNVEMEVEPNVDKVIEEESEPDERVGWWWPFIVLGLGALLYYLLYLNDDWLPKPVTLEDIRLNPNQFSAELSQNLSRAIQEFGPRVVGSDENEIYTPKFIEDYIDAIIEDADPRQDIQRFRQIGSGSYLLSYNPPLTNIYNNIQNVFVKVSGYYTNHSVLVNCHYDSVATADGAADDVISCTVMMEIIRVLSLSPNRLKYNIIFLFNGAEETQLQAAHMFLSHEEAKTCRVVVNLEAAGVGGRNVLFQSGPDHSWLFKYYARYARYPHGQVLGEELFQNGVIPSDSDFRIFRDFGGMPGMDFAFWRNGYIYHTKYDTEDYNPIGSHQILGENTLALVKAYAEAPELEDIQSHSEGKVVYYDYLGWFMIHYSTEANIALNICTIIASLSTFVVFVGFPPDWSKAKELSISIVVRIVAMFAAIGVVAIIGLIVDAAAKLAMPWYSNPTLIFPIYWAPCLIVNILIPYAADYFRMKKHGMSVVETAQMNVVAVQVPFLIALLILTSMGLRSSSLFFMPVLSSAVANLVVLLSPLRRTAYHWIWVYVVIHVPSLLFNIYMVIMCYMFFMPIFGRSGVGNYDLVMAIITSLFIYYVMNFALPLMTLVSRPVIIMGLLGLTSFLMIIISLSTDLGHPYKVVDTDGPRPLRYWIFHTNRIFYDESQMVRRVENGFFIYPFDVNGERVVPVLDNETMTPLTSDCDTELTCGVPLYHSRMIPLTPDTHWIPSTAPTNLIETNLTLIQRQCNPVNLSCTYDFSLTGPDRKTLTFSPRPGAELRSWDIDAEILETSRWHGRPVYFLHIVHGRVTQPFTISLTFNVTTDLLNDVPIMDISLAGNMLHHEELMDYEFKEFVNRFPIWTQITPIISSFKSFIF